MGNKDFNYKRKAHVSEDVNLKKYMYDLHRKQDLIGAIIFAVVLVILLIFAPKPVKSAEKTIKDEITAWYEDTSLSIKNELLGIGNFITTAPEKLGTGLSNYWEEIKTYQADSWKQTREENPNLFSTLDKLKEFFLPTDTKKE
jgi:gas vesicle protein